jgi:hypothetical protein
MLWSQIGFNLFAYIWKTLTVVKAVVRVFLIQLIVCEFIHE